jgi:hypothetical protein
MPDIDKSKYDRNRYFACLALMIMDLDELSSNWMIRGYAIRRIFNKYKMELSADKKRCRVGLLLPPELNKDEILLELQRELRQNFKKYERAKNHIKAQEK